MFCENCGTKLKEGSQFCKECGVKAAVTVQRHYGHVSGPGPIPTIEEKKAVIPFASVFGIALTGLLAVFAVYAFVKLRTKLTGWLIAAAVLVISYLLQRFVTKRSFKNALVIFTAAVITVSGAFAFTTDTKTKPLSSLFNPGRETGVIATSSSDSSGEKEITIKSTIAKDEDRSSLVSAGVNLDDLGNIINGQYYFINGNDRYYSSFDERSMPHIYKADSSGNAEAIFDGFGWSLVVYNDWLYFSGNEGTYIDGSYNLFRMKKDGSNLEKINTGFCYGMSFYNEWLYYIKTSSIGAGDYSFWRSALDGSGEETVVAKGGFCGVVFENRIYYLDSGYILNSAATDGTDAKTVISEQMKNFVIGNGKIVYTDSSNNIKTADTDGKNIKVIREAGTEALYTLNSFRDEIYYTSYENTDSSYSFAYPYKLNTIGFDGSGDRNIYSGISYGIYINILDDGIYVLDYAPDASSGILTAITRRMDFNGNGVTELMR